MKHNHKWVAVSGGFDPIHIGHIRMIQQARKLGDRVVVILNNDNWLRDKKGFVFMSAKERAEVLMACGVDRVYITKHKAGDTDRSVNKALADLKPAVFANGGDRKLGNIPEVEVCKKYNIEMAFNIGKGGKVQSSSWLTDAVRRSGIKTDRPWGSMVLYAHGPNFWIKTLRMQPGQRTSLQKHKGRGELWMCIEGEVYAEVDGKTHEMRPFEVVNFKKGVVHRLGSTKGGTIVELAYGDCDEADNTRLEDDYGRIS